MSFFASATITTDAALRDLASPRPRVRAAAALALSEVEPTRRADALAALVLAADDPDAQVRASAALSLGDLGDPSAADALILRLDDGAPAVRQSAAIALARLRSPAAVEPLRQALADGPPDLRFQAATSLAEIDPEGAKAPLRAALDDPDPEVVGAAALGLGAIGDRADADRLARLLDHGSPRTRFDAAYALAELGDGRAVPVLAGAAASDRELGWDAIEGLEAIGRSAADALAGLVADIKFDPEHRMRAAAALLASAPDHAEARTARRALLEPLASWWSRRRGLAVELLAKVGGSWAIAPLEEMATRAGGRRLGEEIGEALRRIRERTAGEERP